MNVRKDLVSDLHATNAMTPATISSSTTTHGVIIDTQGYSAVAFFLRLGVVTDGTYTALVEESNDSGLSGAITTNAANLIDPQALTTTGVTVTGTYKLGYVPGNYRYVRLSVVSASVTSGATLVGANAALLALQGPAT